MHRRRQAVGVALPGAVLFAEASTLVRRIGNPDYGTQSVWPAVIETALAVLVVLVLARGLRPRVTTALWCVALALLGWASFG